MSEYQNQDLEVQEMETPKRNAPASEYMEEETEGEYFKPQQAREILRLCHIDSEIIEMIINTEVSIGEIYNRMAYMKYKNILDMEHGLQYFKDHNNIPFKTPSEYLDGLSARQNIKTGSYPERFKKFEALMFEFYNLYRDNYSNLEQNLNRAFENQLSQNYVRTYNNPQILNSTKQRLFITFILQRLTTMDQAHDWLKKQFIDKALKNAKNPEECDVSEFRALYSRECDTKKLLSLCFGYDNL